MSLNSIDTQNHSPLVSIIMAAYNCSVYIDNAIKSVISQDIQEWELIIIDDASIDETVDKVHSYQDPRIILVKNEHNLGPSVARNKGLEIARGKWLAILDGDDWFLKRRLEIMLKYADESNPDILIDDLHLFDNNSSKFYSTKFTDTGLHVDQPVWLSAVEFSKLQGFSVKPLFKRSFLEKNNIMYKTDVKVGEDFLILIDCYLADAKVLVIPEKLYVLRRGNTGSLTTKKLFAAEHLSKSARDIAYDERVAVFPELQQVLRERFVRLERMLTYYRLSQFLVNGQVTKFLFEIKKNPQSLKIITDHLLQRISVKAKQFIAKFKNLL